jgi:Pro-kumamolisin, activation domain
LSNRPKQRRLALAAVVSAAIASAGGSIAIASTSDAASTSTSHVARVLANTVPSMLADARELGQLVSTQRISVDLPLILPHKAALDAYVAGEYTPGNPDYHKFLTPAQFGLRFGAPAAELTAATNALHALGLNTTAPDANHLFVGVTGTVATVERAFTTHLANFKLGSLPSFYANTGDITLPASLSRLVSGVIGLDSAGTPEPQLQRPSLKELREHPNLGSSSGVDGGATPCAQANLGGGYTAPDLAAGYDFDGLYAKGLHGEGMTAALVEFDDFHDSNVATMESCYGIKTPVTRRFVDGGVGGTPGAGEAEDMADITTLLEMDPKLAHLYVYEAPITGGGAVLKTGDAEIDLYNDFVSDDFAPVLSSSWGNCEELQSQAYNQLFATVAEEAAAQGQQIFDAAGDSGAVDCRGSATPTSGSVSVEQEAAVPWITGVGGTDLGVESTVQGSGVHDEDTWNDAGAGGGGQSTVWTMPSWQASYMAATHDTPSGEADDCGAPAGQYCRMVPDISLDADPDAGGAVNQGPVPPQFFGTDVGSPGYSIYCATSNCSLTSQLLPIGGLPIGLKPPSGAGGWYPIGGTSLATPLAASAAVLWDQEAKRGGLSGVGFLNPSLYRVASNPAVYQADFHDITTDSNDDQYDTTDCPTGCNPGHLYSAGPGYDMASGLGSFDAAKLGASLIAAGGAVALTPSSETMYGYRNGPATSNPVSITSGFVRARYRARSSAKWLTVRRSGGVPATLSWQVNPKRLGLGTHRGTITVTGTGGSTATLNVIYVVTRPARISVSPGSLHFSEQAIDSNGNATAATCGSSIWNDELESEVSGAPSGVAVGAGSRHTLTIRNTGPAGSVLHYQALLYTYTGDWLSQDLDPGNNPNGFQTTPSQPLVATTGSLAHGKAASLPLASVANSNAVGGYAAMNQGTYKGIVQIRDESDPAIIKTIPVTLSLGSGNGTPTIKVAAPSITVGLAPSTLARVDLLLSDPSGTCGYAYSLASNQPWVTYAPYLESGTVGANPASAVPSNPTDTGSGNGLTPVTISSAGMRAGRTYHARITVQSQNAAGDPATVPVTVHVFGPHGHTRTKRKHRR